MNVKIYLPHPALQDYVLNLFTVDEMLPPGMDEAITPYPPSPFQSLMFYCDDPVSMNTMEMENFELQPNALLTGPQFSRVNIKVHGKLRSVRVDFIPGALHRLLGIPMHQLFDCGFDAREIFGSGLRALDERLQHTADLEEGKNLVQHFLLAFIANAKSVLPFDSAMRAMVNSNGNMTVEQAASLSCLSLKQFERTCKDRIGMNPKLYSRILRFSKAYRLHEASPRLSWIHIAHEAGYFDQMHLIKDFKAFAGVNPSVIEQQLKETPLRMQKDIRG